MTTNERHDEHEPTSWERNEELARKLREFEPDEDALKRLREFQPDEDAIKRLRAAFETAAHAEGLVDVAYRTLDTPVGLLLLAATESGLVRVAFAREDHAKVLERLSEQVSPRVLKSPGRLDNAARQVDEYFEGNRHSFDLPIDFQLSHGFRREVLGHLQAIDYGETASYAKVAAAIGNPGAVRAVGTACATNPIPVVVPCHRVVKSDGSIGNYAGGVEAKQALLNLEGAMPATRPPSAERAHPAAYQPATQQPRMFG